MLKEAKSGKVYGGTALRAARHFHSVGEGAATLAVADELRRRPEVEVIAVVDPDGRPRGIITRDRLFALVGKPFGREVLGRSAIGEFSEAAPSLDVHAGIFAVAADTLSGNGDCPFRLLVDEEGLFRGLLSARDLSDHLSRMTQDDIDLAGQIQLRLEEGNEGLDDPRLDFDAWSRAAKGVGGDFWHTRRLEDGKVFFALCDVSGKGVAASLVVSMVWGMLLMYDFSKGLVELIKRLNESLVLTFRLERYLTGFFAILDPGTGLLDVADMGHSHAFILRGGRALRLRSKAGNMPVGIDREILPHVERWRLRVDDRLFAYSDGLTEQEDAAGGEFGEGRLAAAILGAIARGQSLRQSLPSALDRFRGRIPQQDDMSFLSIGWKGQS